MQLFRVESIKANFELKKKKQPASVIEQWHMVGH